MSHSRRVHEPSLNHSVVIGLLELDLRIPLCHSLKAKRGVLARVMNQLRKEFPLVLAEVGDQDVWGRSGLAAVTISNESSTVESVFMGAVRCLEHNREIELVHYGVTFL